MELPVKVASLFFQHVGVVLDNSGHVSRACFGQRNGRNGWTSVRTNGLEVDIFCFLLIKTGFVKTCTICERIALCKNIQSRGPCNFITGMSSSKSSSQLSVCSSGKRRGIIGTGATDLSDTVAIVVWVGFARLGELSLRASGGGEGDEGVGEEARGGNTCFVVVDRGGAVDGSAFAGVTTSGTDEHFNASFHA